MDQRRRHYFPDNDCHVITGLCPNGEFGAYRESEDEGRVRGYGHTRLAAIADLVEAISNTEEDEERNSAAFQLDHARDYRKHEAINCMLCVVGFGLCVFANLAWGLS